jgi:hypothetical protein
MFFRAIAAAPVTVGFVVAALPFAFAAAVLFPPQRVPTILMMLLSRRFTTGALW